MMTTPQDRVLTDDQRIDEAGAESFPASDPPSWTSGLDRRLPAEQPPPRHDLGAEEPGSRRAAAAAAHPPRSKAETKANASLK